MTATLYSLQFVILLFVGWFFIANYISLVLHRGISHKAISLPRWYMFGITWVCNTFFLYVNPRTWVADHRCHHAYSDTEDDPDKHPGDSFWGWFFRFLRHNPSVKEERIQKFSRDDIFDSFTMKFISSSGGGMFCQVTGVVLPMIAFWNVWLGLSFWLTLRVLGLLVLSLQSYFGHSHQLGFGARRYELKDDSGNLMNPVAQFLTAGECLQNNHHAAPRRASHSHHNSEWDPGYDLLRFLVWVGIAEIPEQKPLESIHHNLVNVVPEENF